VSIGSDVAAARAAAGRTLDDVAEATRVRTAVIDRIEHDDFSLCGGDVYARGHLRAIGHALEVDPEPWVAEYDAQHAPDVAPLDLVEQHEVRERGRTPNWTTAMALALAVVVGFGVWTAVSGGGDDSPAADPGIVAVESEPAPPTSSAPAKPEVTVQPERDAVAAVDDVTLTLAAKEGKSWVSVSDSSGDPLYQGTMEIGQRKTFRDDSKLSLVVGNGAAVALTVNGQDLGAPGGQGEVVRLTFGPGDPSAG
jgi:cytoskeletal protein RodZ